MREALWLIPYLLALAVHEVTDGILRRVRGSEDAGPPKPWVVWLWYASGLAFTSGVAWWIIDSRAVGSVEQHAWGFPALLATATVVGFVSSRPAPLPGEPRSVLPVPIQLFLVGLLLGSAFTTSASPGLLRSLWPMWVVTGLCVVGLYREALDWAWARLLSVGPAISTAARRLLRAPRRP